MNDTASQLEVASKLLAARTEDLRVALTRLGEIADALDAIAKRAREPLRSPQRAA
jgi:ActR/RegA family two-component response regulator